MCQTPCQLSEGTDYCTFVQWHFLQACNLSVEIQNLKYTLYSLFVNAVRKRYGITIATPSIIECRQTEKKLETWRASLRRLWFHKASSLTCKQHNTSAMTLRSPRSAGVRRFIPHWEHNDSVTPCVRREHSHI